MIRSKQLVRGTNARATLRALAQASTELHLDRECTAQQSLSKNKSTQNRDGRSTVLLLAQDTKQRFLNHFVVIFLTLVIVGSGGLPQWFSTHLPPFSPQDTTLSEMRKNNSGEIVRPLPPTNTESDVEGSTQISPDLIPPKISSAPIFNNMHTVVVGDTLRQIAATNGISVESLLWANNLQDGGMLSVGRELRIPRVSGIPYATESEETLLSIAERFGVPVQAIIAVDTSTRANNDIVAPGTELFIAGAHQPFSDRFIQEYGSVEEYAARPAQLAGQIREAQTNIRSGPGRAYPRVIQLNTGVAVVPLARHDSWVHVQTDQGDGWLLSELVAWPAGLAEGLPEISDVPPPPPMWVWPTHGELTSPFGSRWGKLHNGIDIANNAWTPIVAARAGRVFEAGWCSGFGYCVKIDHGDGIQTIYGHLVTKPRVRVGDEVAAGQFIGSMGSTYDASGGGYSTGVHLHFTVKVNGRAVDPRKFLP